jgi:uncharacterized protein YdeI (YjbR/CyaY-like superfamily)
MDRFIFLYIRIGLKNNYTCEGIYLKMKEYHHNILAIEAPAGKHWRVWLQKNHEKEDKVWLIIYHKTSPIKSIYYDEAVEEALCFGWIDSKPNKRDHESYYLFFSKRSPKSNWSKINRERVSHLIADGRMTASGMAFIELAKQQGTWLALESAEQNIVPEDLQNLFNKNSKSFTYFQAFPRSAKQAILEWINQAKRPETRAKRIKATVELAAQNIRANQYKKEA